MSKRFKLAVLPKEKQLDNVKYALRIENPSALGNVYGLTEEEKYMCMAVFNKICANADAYLKKYAEGENEKSFLL